MTADRDNMRRTILDLFSEIAIVRNLAGTRLEDAASSVVTQRQFGVLNRFVRNDWNSESETAIAWAFLEEPDYTAEKIDEMVALGHLTVEPNPEVAGDRIVTITEKGRLTHSASLDAMSPAVMPLFEGIDMADVETTICVLRELRRTLDNLPDR
jgi:DNA-binding MarR family transcriptional regulator